MESKLLKNIIKSTNDIRKKYNAIKTGKIDKELLLEETFKPISKPLQELKEKNEAEIDKKIRNEVKKEIKEELSVIDPISNVDRNNDSFKLAAKIFKFSPLTSTNTTFNTPDKINSSKQLSTLHSTPNMNIEESAKYSIDSNISIFDANRTLAAFYVKEYTNNSRNVDKAFGQKYNESLNAFQLGRNKIIFKENSIVIGGDEYPATQGLYELIFMKNPDDYTQTDLENYKKIILESNVYRTLASDINSKIKGKSSDIYKNIISQIIREKRGTDS